MRYYTWRATDPVIKIVNKAGIVSPYFLNVERHYNPQFKLNIYRTGCFLYVEQMFKKGKQIPLSLILNAL